MYSICWISISSIINLTYSCKIIKLIGKFHYGRNAHISSGRSLLCPNNEYYLTSLLRLIIMFYVLQLHYRVTLDAGSNISTNENTNVLIQLRSSLPGLCVRNLIY